MQLTFISAEKPLTKSYLNGKVTSFQHQKNVTSHMETATTIEEMYDAIKQHAKQGHALMKGHFNKPLVNESRAGRTLNASTTNWLVLDIDGLDDVDTPEDFFQHIPELKNISYIRQYSASYKIKSNKLNAHIFFQLDEPISPRMLKTYLKSLNLRDGIRNKLRLNDARSALKYLVDPTVADESRIVYIAPPMSNRPLPLTEDEYIALIKKDKPTLTIPAFNPGVIDESMNVIRDELRKQEGLAAKKGLKLTSNANGETYTLDTEPDSIRIFVHNVSTHSGWVQCNVNDGDSNAYYFPLGKITQQTVMRNWKGEPYFYVAKADPEFQKEWNNTHIPQLIKENPELGKLSMDDLNQDLVPLPEDENHFIAFDILESSYKAIRFQPDSRKLEITRHEMEKLKNYALTTGIELPEIKPIYTFVSDISSQATSPIDHAKRKVNSWILPKNLDATLLPLPEGIGLNTLSIKETIDLMKQETPLCYSLIDSALGNDLQSLKLFINWFAITTIHRIKLRTAWIIQGTQGTGKSAIVQEIAKRMFDMDESRAVSKSLRVLDEATNAWAERAVIIEWEEANTSGKTVKDKDKVDHIKRLITNTTITLRVMYRDGIQAPNQFNMIFTSNHNVPWQIPADDRRMFVSPRQNTSWTSTIPEDKKDDWELRFAETLDEETPKLAGILHCLKTDLLKANTVVMTPAKKAAIDAGRTAGQGLLDALINGDLEWIDEALDSNDVDTSQLATQSIARGTFADLITHFGTPATSGDYYVVKWKDVCTLHAAVNNTKPIGSSAMKAFATNAGIDVNFRGQLPNGERPRGLKVPSNEMSRGYAAKKRMNKV